MILVISSYKDEHSQAVINKLNMFGESVSLLDLSNFPRHQTLSISYSQNKTNNFIIVLEDQTEIDLSSCKSVWWRRPQPFVPHDSLSSEYKHFVLNESYEAFTGLWHSLDAFWVNSPRCDEVAHRKVFQLRTAQQVGLQIPNTLISNCPEAAESFIQQNGYQNTIYKSFSATEQHWRETRILKQNELELLDSVRYSPVIFQEYIAAEYDIRLTVVGKQLFAAAIYSQQTAYKVDMRMDIANARMEAIKLPKTIERKIIHLMEILGLQYGAIDLRLTPNGEYVFLEINPAGQWLFIEQETQQPITQAIAELLSMKANI